MRLIKDLTDGNSISGIYYCKQKVSTETKNGKPYDSIILQDKSGVLDGKVWEPYSPGIREYEAGDFIEVYGDVITYNNAKQAKLTKIRKADVDEYNESDYFPVTSKNIDDMFAQVTEYINSVTNTYLKSLLEEFFVKDTELVYKFKKSSAAKTVHHGFIGGLLEHTLSVTNMCDYYAKAYPVINRDLLITAALIHDIGKTREISQFPENDYTDEGQFLGHIVMGCEMVSEKTANIEGFPVELRNELKHCILAHHGEYEYGSPKKPAIIEAVALNFADNTDAKFENIIELFKANTSDGWLGYNKMLDSNFKKTVI